MTRTLTGIGSSTLVSRIRLQKCSHSGCLNRTRMALVVPCLDIEEDGGPGLAAIKVCSEHIEQAIVTLSKGSS